MSRDSWQVCSLVVTCVFAHLQHVQQQLKTIPKLTIPAINHSSSKIVVLIESENSEQLFDYIGQIGQIEHVVEVALAYHQQDALEEVIQ